MNTFIGIDLGTTNSTICMYNGERIRILKSPEQNDVTPSAILIDKRGNKYIGKRAYDSAPGSPDNAALLFKRFMGSGTIFKFASSGEEKTPEACSAEVLKILFGYLPEELRSDSNIGIVVTIPAAFNQMQKDATVEAAHLAGLGRVVLMQEPVAAVMSVMRMRKTDGIFLIYDFGGGTLDVAIAESIGGRVNLLANGGIQMCGGRDIDRIIFDNIVKPWFFEKFNLPTSFSSNSKYKRLIRFSNWAIEKAKIELSSKEVVHISLSEIETGTHDEAGEEIYLDVIINRSQLDSLIEEKIMESVQAVRDTLNHAGISPTDIEKIVFIGGPTNYKPLRDKVCFELGISGSTEINPMTSVAEGAALFAESIDWNTVDNARKSSRGHIQSDSNLGLSFVYTTRTPDSRSKVVVKMQEKSEEQAEFQIDSLDTGWTSGRIKLEHNAMTTLPLSKNGDNTFKIFVFNAIGRIINLTDNMVVIRRTVATIDAIPASHSIGIAVREKAGGAQTLDWLVRVSDSLPKKGKLHFTSAETLKSGSSGSLNFNLWEGEILDPITDNRLIGVLKIKGNDFDDGIIVAGTELICEYEILDSGVIHLEVEVPSIGAVFSSNHNFYSRQEGQLDFNLAGEQINQDLDLLEERVDNIEKQGIEDEKLDIARNKISYTRKLTTDTSDVEKTQEAQERLLEVKKMFAQIRKNHVNEIRQIELDTCVAFFNNHVREYARQSEKDSFDILHRTSRRNIERNSRDFEGNLDEMKRYNFVILWRQDWFAIDYFNQEVKAPQRYMDSSQFNALVQQGNTSIKNDNIEQLRKVIGQMTRIRIYNLNNEELMDDVNIIRR